MNNEHGSDSKSTVDEIFKNLGSSSPYLKQAWSDDESTIASLSIAGKYMRRRGFSQTSNDESTILSLSSRSNTIGSSQSNTRGSFNFNDWLDYTKNLTELVSKQITGCTSGQEEYETKEPGFTLKDEDFYWGPTSSSYDTADTRRTNDLRHSTFSRWDQRVKLWDSDRTNMIKNSDNASFKEQDTTERRDPVS